MMLRKNGNNLCLYDFQIDRFLAVINANRPVINLYGFVEVNRSLITSVSINNQEQSNYSISEERAVGTRDVTFQ
jgi:hypothetical protein